MAHPLGWPWTITLRSWASLGSTPRTSEGFRTEVSRSGPAPSFRLPTGPSHPASDLGLWTC
eukprot:8607502-Alexandrium_andersonii.AAC.1